jgi:presenilin-like A22 family membrane protease
MTIMDHLKRRRNKAALLVLPGVAFCVLSAVFVPDSFWLNWLSLAALFAGLVGVIVLMNRTPCPRCRQPLGSIAARAANGWAKTAHCPHCRVGFDEPLGNLAHQP